LPSIGTSVKVTPNSYQKKRDKPFNSIYEDPDMLTKHSLDARTGVFSAKNETLSNLQSSKQSMQGVRTKTAHNNAFEKEVTNSE
jgi:hypothetical protein